MTLELSPEHERQIELAIASGAYHSRDEVIAQALDMLNGQLQREDWMSACRDEVEAHIEIGFAQSERGELISADEGIAILRRRRAEGSRSAR